MNKNALADTGVLIAVPLNREEFRQRARDSDWLGKFCPPDAGIEEIETAIEARWREVYLPLVAEPLQEVADFASLGNAEVRTGAVLSDLAAMTQSRRLVILFAHWKGPEIVFDDLIHGPNPDVFLNASADLRGALGKWVTAEFRKISRKPGSDALLEVLNDALDVTLEDSDGLASSILEHDVTRRTRRRRELESLFPDLLRRGNRLEMFDGLHTKEEVEASVASDFDGILDLPVCTSTVLADYIAAKRRHRLRTVQFPMVVEFIWAAKAVGGALQLKSSGNLEYLDARNLVTGEFNQAIREAEKERWRKI